MPKQFLTITDDGKTMIQLTVERIASLVKMEDIYIATNKDYRKLVLEQLPGIPSLDSRLQDMLQADIDQGLSSYTELQDNGKYALQGAGVIVDNQSNYVVAIVGGRGSVDQFNRGSGSM